jgi:glycosyltransferase involved in cell wall biosynthesis
MNADTAMPTPRLPVALVMPVRNEGPAVEAGLASVVDSTRVPDEIVVADGRSTDDTRARIADFAARHPVPPVTVVDNPSIWVGGGRNRGIEATAKPVILICDFGNRLDPGWIEAMMRPFERDPTVELVAGVFRPWVSSDFEHCVACIHYYEDYILQSLAPDERARLLPQDVMPGGMAIGCRRDLWARADGFPEWLRRGSDKMFGRKAVAMGVRTEVAWDAVVDHHMRATPGALFRQLLHYGRGNGQMCYLSRHVLKLLLVYATLVALGVVGLWWPPAWGAAAVGLLGYVAHQAWRKLWRIHRRGLRPWRWSYPPLAAAALVARDVGSVLGHLWGWAEWAARPKFRRLYTAYLRDCSPERLRVVAR